MLQQILKTLTSLVILTTIVTGCENKFIAPDSEDLRELADGHAALSVFLNARDLQKPLLTRATEGIDPSKDVWVIVFDGSDGTATFKEIVVASNPTSVGTSASGDEIYSYVFKPETSETPVRLLIIANMPKKFCATAPPYDPTTNPPTEYDFTVANVTTTLTGRTYSEAVNTVLNTPMLGMIGRDHVVFDPNEDRYNSGAAFIPMSGTKNLDKLNSTISIGTAAAPVELTRAVAKITVTNKATNFKITSVTSLAFAMNGTIAPQTTPSLRSNKKNIGHYAQAPIARFPNQADYPTVNTPQWTAPLYAYEYSMPISEFDMLEENQPLLIVRGIYKDGTGETNCYYVMSFPDNTMLRNKHYNFVINSVEVKGIEAAIINVDGYHQPSNGFNYRVDVTDLTSHDIQRIGDVYLALSNSELIIYQTDAITDYTFATVSTNANFRGVSMLPISMMHNGAYGNGLITAPTISTIPIAGIENNDVSYPIKASLNSDVTTATVHIAYPPLYKEIPITRHPTIPIGGAHITDFATNDFIFAELANPADASWIGFATTGGPAIYGRAQLESYVGGIHLHVAPNTTSANRHAEIYLARKSDKGRLKVLLTQSIIAPPTFSDITATRNGTVTEEFSFTLSGTFAKGTAAATTFGWEIWTENNGQLWEITDLGTNERFEGIEPITNSGGGQNFSYVWKGYFSMYYTQDVIWNAYNNKVWLRVYIIDSNGTKWYDTTRFTDPNSQTFMLYNMP